jgi:hypothetical protein
MAINEASSPRVVARGTSPAVRNWGTRARMQFAPCLVGNFRPVWLFYYPIKEPKQETIIGQIGRLAWVDVRTLIRRWKRLNLRNRTVIALERTGSAFSYDSTFMDHPVTNRQPNNRVIQRT